MSMNLSLKRASDGDIAKLHETPKAIHAFIKENRQRSPELEAARAAMMAEMGLAPPPVVHADFDTYTFDDKYNARKLWHGLHFLLTGTVYEGTLPAAYLLGGTPIGEEDVGYGPARSISAAETRIFSTYLDGLDRTEFLDRLDPDRMQALDIYPQIWDEDAEELKEELGDTFDALRTYCRKCAEVGLGLVATLS